MTKPMQSIVANIAAPALGQECGDARQTSPVSCAPWVGCANDNGQTTFALPDLSGRLAVDFGQSLGQSFGLSNVRRRTFQLPTLDVQRSTRKPLTPALSPGYRGEGVQGRR